MSELEEAKKTLEKTIESIKTFHKMPEEMKGGLLTRAQSSLNVLVQNEKKIWLKTGPGKAMLRDFNSSASKLLRAVVELTDLWEIEAALAEVEAQAKRIDEETRRRSMVVT